MKYYNKIKKSYPHSFVYKISFTLGVFGNYLLTILEWTLFGYFETIKYLKKWHLALNNSNFMARLEKISLDTTVYIE